MQNGNLDILEKSAWLIHHQRKKGVLYFVQRHENWSAVDLKQCMPVRKCVWLEPAPTPRHCHVWHQSTTIAFREQPADSADVVSPERLEECWWRHSCFTTVQIHHMNPNVLAYIPKHTTGNHYLIVLMVKSWQFVKFAMVCNVSIVFVSRVTMGFVMLFAINMTGLLQYCEI